MTKMIKEDKYFSVILSLWAKIQLHILGGVGLEQVKPCQCEELKIWISTSHLTLDTGAL